MKKLISFLVCVCMLCSFASCGGAPFDVQAENLMDGIKGNAVTGKHVNDTFRTAQMAFALELFQRSVEDAEKENMLISPLSVMLALSMTANGATGETKAQMEEVLGLSVKELNEYLYSYIHSLPSDDKAKFGVANSIWFRDGLEVLPSFLQKNADYYGAAAYQSAFDDATVKDINNWVKENTDGLIEKMLDSIDASTVMYLINTVLFDAKWQKEYRKDQTREGFFYAYDGKEQIVDMMHSTENMYLSDEHAVGVMKPYAGGNYSFAALLPNEGVDVYDYVALLTCENLLSILDNAQNREVITAIPKFDYAFELTMNDVLKEMGMELAFQSAGGFGALAKGSDDLYIGKVLHKSRIVLDEKGTKAAASTMVGMDECASPEETKYVSLNRPFVYMIVDNQTNLPIFMGVVNQIER